jgi:DtxR family transcriptional regulator, Mn-dependent transcriptional regulator
MEQISKEDYLRTIFFLYEKLDDEKKGVSSVDIAKKLGISKPSVSEMLKKLKKKGYVKFIPYSKVFLTKKGLNEAKRVMHNHRIIEVFLKKVLKYELSKVHDEANRLEHAFSEESIKRLEKFLKNPKKSPHGQIIPHDKK